MQRKFAEMTVYLPVSQYVKVEDEAQERNRTPESTASFLLSDWVMATSAGEIVGKRLASEACEARGRAFRAVPGAAQDRKGEKEPVGSGAAQDRANVKCKIENVKLGTGTGAEANVK